MLYKLLLFLGLIGAESAHLDHYKSDKLEVNLNEEQLSKLNKAFKDHETEQLARESLSDHLDSMIYDNKTKRSTLVLRFK